MPHFCGFLIIFVLILIYLIRYTRSLSNQIESFQVEPEISTTSIFQDYRTDPAQTRHRGANHHYHDRTISINKLVYDDPYPDIVNFSEHETKTAHHYAFHTYRAKAYPTQETMSSETVVSETSTTSPETVSPETPTSSSEKPHPETPHPETPYQETPSPETVAPETPSPSPETPHPETPSPETPSPEIPSPEIPNHEIPNPETTNPETPNPETPSPETVAPETPTPSPETPYPETPSPETVAPETPTPSSETPHPETPSPETVAPEIPGNPTPTPQPSSSSNIKPILPPTPPIATSNPIFFSCSQNNILKKVSQNGDRCYETVKEACPKTFGISARNYQNYICDIKGKAEDMTVKEFCQNPIAVPVDSELCISCNKKCSF